MLVRVGAEVEVEVRDSLLYDAAPHQVQEQAAAPQQAAAPIAVRKSIKTLTR